MANNDQIHAEAETAWALAVASEEAVRALCSVADPALIRMAWLLGHYKGRLAGMTSAENIYAESMIRRDKLERGAGRTEHDLDSSGRPLKSGS